MTDNPKPVFTNQRAYSFTCPDCSTSQLGFCDTDNVVTCTECSMRWEVTLELQRRGVSWSHQKLKQVLSHHRRPVPEEMPNGVRDVGEEDR